MKFQHTRANYAKTANLLIEHLRESLGDPSTRRDWTHCNLDVLRSFTLEGLTLTHYPLKDNRKRSNLTGQFLWDHMSCTEEDVILIAESEWLSSFDEIRHDFEKLLYTRCPIKLMMCGKWKLEPAKLAARLSEYAQSCSSNYGPGEVFILYCVGWLGEEGNRNDEVFSWQVDGAVVMGKDPFKFDPIAADRPVGD